MKYVCLDAGPFGTLEANFRPVGALEANFPPVDMPEAKARQVGTFLY
jgi:hypothetical protein